MRFGGTAGAGAVVAGWATVAMGTVAGGGRLRLVILVRAGGRFGVGSRRHCGGDGAANGGG